MNPFFVTIPHSGERVPDLCPWLKGLPVPLLFCDIDRYVDQLYAPVLEARKIPFVKTEWHRYAADLNRLPEDIDETSVMGSKNPKGSFPRGFHWVITTKSEVIMPKPISQSDHEALRELIFEPFHLEVRKHYENLFKTSKKVYHLDLHSMPSLGTSEHRDPGERRAEIVVSDGKGVSADPNFVDLVINSYVRAGFKVGYNWPYYGGRVVDLYGHPQKGQHCVQVELNRALYMDENTKDKTELFAKAQSKLSRAIELVELGIPKL